MAPLPNNTTIYAVTHKLFPKSDLWASERLLNLHPLSCSPKWESTTLAFLPSSSVWTCLREREEDITAAQ